MEINKIYNEDCLEGMKKIPDKYFDLVVTDPPYGINISAKKQVGGENLAKCNQYKISNWDNKIPSKEYFDEIIRISKNQIIFGGNYFIQYLYNSPCWIVWDKNNTGNFADCELAWTSFKSAVRKFKWTWNGFIQEDMKNKEKKGFHPTQKPVGLMKQILEKYSKESDKICDPFCGSGSILLACLDTNRNFIGFELDKNYYDIACKRIENHKQKLGKD